MLKTSSSEEKTKQKGDGFLSALYYIAKVGNYEARILWRSWMFRIFSALILGILILFDLFGVLGLDGSGEWSGRNIPGNITYINFFLFTIGQVIIAAFLSADFLGRERKMDTTEVFYTRPMSNLQYVLGKTWGTLMIFGGLNMVVMFLSLIVTLLTPDSVFAISPFIFFLLGYSLPSLLFILGFSFFLMVVIRNQAVTFVLVLGFGAMVLFYLKNMNWGIWDFMGFYLPVQYSGFVGFCNFSGILMQRAAFLLFGLFGVILTAYFLPRLPGYRRQSFLLLFSGFLLLIGSGILFYSIVSGGVKGRELRKNIRITEATLPIEPCAKIDSCSLQVKHLGDHLKCTSEMKISVLKHTDSLLLAVNPGFIIDEVRIDGRLTDFNIQFGIINVCLDNLLVPGDSIFDCQIDYRGAPSDQAIYPYIDEESRENLSRFDPLVAGKKHSFVQSHFVLLTEESGWYPIIAWKNYRRQHDFTNFSLEFSSVNNLQAFSQGDVRLDGKSIVFVNNQPLNALTLLAGEYKTDTITVDDITYQLSVQKDNRLVDKYFNQIGDTLPTLIGDLKAQYEGNLKLKYPFKKLKVIEVPIHFYTYLQSCRLGTDHIQPELILLPEYGGGSWFLDLNRTRDDFEEEAEQQGMDADEVEIQSKMFVTLVGNTFLFPRWRIFQSGQNINRNLEGWNRNQIFPLYFYYSYQIREKGWPVFQIMLGEALRNEATRDDNSWRAARDQYRGHLALKKHSLSEWLKREEAGDTIARILNLTGIQFFSEISALSSTDGDFVEMLKEPLHTCKFEQSRPSDWMNCTGESLNIQGKYHQLTDNKELPAFQFGDIATSKIQQRGKTEYIVSLNVANYGGTEGVLDMHISFLDLTENRHRSFSQWMYQNIENDQNIVSQLYIVPARKSGRINMIFDQLPKEIKVNTGVARNIPPIYSFPLNNFENTESERADQGFHLLDTITQVRDETNVFIVDNEDPGFLIESQDEVKTLKDWWLKHESKNIGEYSAFRHWNPQPVWVTTLDENYFGRYLRSAALKASGKGDDQAKWICQLPEGGIYEVEVYIPSNMETGWRYRNSKGVFHYKIFHANGSDAVDSPPVRERNGWVSLGRFFFNKGEAIVELSDQSDFIYVVADAVKWIKCN
jgi:ABC-type transport system involved in multi-copper enzyme maturation permease subunit